jgi:hypothetical protein
MRFYGLSHQGFWFDEADTAKLLHFSPEKMFSLLPQSESTPPLYYGVAWAWTRIFGTGEAGLRSLSALCGVLAIPVAYGIGAVLSTRRIALVAAALVAFSPYLIWYSQEARSYEMLVLFTALSILGVARFHARPSSRAPVLWAAASVLALLTHYYAVVVIVPTAAWLLFRHRHRRSVLVAVGLVLACGAALLPLALTQNATKHDAWIATSPLPVRLRQIIPQFLIGTGIPHRPVLKYVGYAAGSIGLLLLALRAEVSERSTGLVMARLIAAGMLLVGVLILAGFDDLITRNIIALIVPGLIALACGFGARRAGRLGLGGAGVLCVLGVVATVAIATDRQLQRPDWRAVARVIGPEPPPGALGRAFFIQDYRFVLPLSLYLRHYWLFPRRGARTTQLDIISIKAPEQPMCYWGAACNLYSSRMQASYRIPGFHTVWIRHARQFTIMHMVASRPVLLRWQAVAASLHTTYFRKGLMLFQHTS